MRSYSSRRSGTCMPGVPIDTGSWESRPSECVGLDTISSPGETPQRLFRQAAVLRNSDIIVEPVFTGIVDRHQLKRRQVLLDSQHPISEVIHGSADRPIYTALSCVILEQDRSRTKALEVRL